MFRSDSRVFLPIFTFAGNVTVPIVSCHLCLEDEFRISRLRHNWVCL